jgi:hypothetical protein
MGTQVESNEMGHDAQKEARLPPRMDERLVPYAPHDVLGRWSQTPGRRSSPLRPKATRTLFNLTKGRNMTTLQMILSASSLLIALLCTGIFILNTISTIGEKAVSDGVAKTTLGCMAGACAFWTLFFIFTH